MVLALAGDSTMTRDLSLTVSRSMDAGRHAYNPNPRAVNLEPVQVYSRRTRPTGRSRLYRLAPAQESSTMRAMEKWQPGVHQLHPTISVHVLEGRRPGPTALVQAGIHGDEIAGVHALCE